MWLKSDAAEEIRTLGKHANPALLAALEDPKRFAAAHVLLGDINRPPSSIDDDHCDQLRITLHADGGVDFHPEQLAKIQKLWKMRFGGD